MKAWIALLAVALLVTGCAQQPAYPETFRSVEELRDAFIEAGGICEEWEQSNKVKVAAESGTCDGSNVLSIYSSETDRDSVVGNMQFSAEILGEVNLLVGKNWIINDPDVKELDPALEGTLVTK